ncbi:MAG: M20/M25/M40 family metallo-hydrolase [Bryobacteraceae bacterium]|nr:M20/M25/M40 family metallo-hydrolase [Bryobacteraceae bacterium]
MPPGLVTADALKAHVSFLASDALEGRNSPSKGLDIAAEYIASRFRALGLKPLGDDGYFQTADWTRSQVNPEGFQLTLEASGKKYEIPYSQVILEPAPKTALAGVTMTRLTLEQASQASDDTLRGQALLINLPPLDRPVMQRYAALRRRLLKLAPTAVVLIAEGQAPPSRGGATLRSVADTPLLPAVIIRQPELASLTEAKLTLNLAPALETPAKMRNVAALLEGEDLRDQAVLVSAHYDHLGLATSGPDTVYNGANDNASGVAGVLEVAAALAKLPAKPRRSVLFLTFFAEEKGLLGARHYTLHPLLPLAQTVANLNFEQLGRTDSSEGPNLDMVNLTGFDFSNLKDTLAAAGALTGVRLVKNEKSSDAFFGASDNQPFADRCVVAHTASVTYEFPDYHQLGDEWRKLDYDNMAKVVRMLGTGVLLLANQQTRPAYDAENSATANYRNCR